MKNLNPIQILDSIEANNPTSLILKRAKEKEIRIFDDRGYDLYYIGRIISKGDQIIFVNFLEVELFRKHNALGLLSELLDCELFLFEYIYLKYNDKIYITTRSNFLKNGIREQFYFGEKIFLQLNYFYVHDPKEPKFL